MTAKLKEKPERLKDEAATSERGATVEIAIEIDRLIARCEALNLRLVAYLLRIARDELSDTLGERVRRH